MKIQWVSEMNNLDKERPKTWDQMRSREKLSTSVMLDTGWPTNNANIAK